MHRDRALRSLSTHHHHALIQANRKLLAAPESPEARLEIAREFLNWWEHAGARHFREEEEVLLPFYVLAGGAWTDAFGKMVRQHASIRATVLALQLEASEGEVRMDTMRRAGLLLDAHVRLEEREVFERIQEHLGEALLPALGERLEAWEADVITPV